jgi:phospholipase D1/2
MMPSVCESIPRERAVAGQPLLRPGDNCWRVERAKRFFCVQDAADYFRLVRHAILQARESVFIVGWDIQATLDLVPQGAGDHARDNAPTRLDELLEWMVRRHPRLRCYILIWDYAALYTLERDPFARWRLGWRMPRQIRFAFDDRHPLGGSHHQKIVLVDDELAFCGGIDLTGHRWDTPAHRVDEPLRVNATGAPYAPYHEIQAMVDGPVAASLGTLVRDRWQALGERTRSRQHSRPRASAPARDLWPAEIAPDLTDVDVAISRTMPPSEQEPAIRECEQLFLDSIAAARRSIYIESQYFTNGTFGRALADRLREPDGPEVIAVIPKECPGWLEQQTMGLLRDETLRDLRAADCYQRLRVVYPAASRTRDVPTFVHSKVMIVDDRFVRIGSANFSRRSMGVDSECDLAAYAGVADDDAGAGTGVDSRHRAGVRRIRDRLIGEHLGMSADEVSADVARLGSLRALIDARADADRTLLPVEVKPPTESPAEIVKTVADPDEPIDVAALAALTALTDLIPAVGAQRDPRSIRWWPRAIVIGAASIAAVLVMLSPSWSNLLFAAAAVLGAYVLASGLRLLLRLRQTSRTVRRDRQRAEFG